MVNIIHKDSEDLNSVNIAFSPYATEMDKGNKYNILPNLDNLQNVDIVLVLISSSLNIYVVLSRKIYVS